MKILNPFIINDYSKPEFFCDRKNETNIILRKLEQNSNILLISNRGIGKTALIKHLYFQIKKNKVKNLIYMDLLFYSTFRKYLTDFFKIISDSVTKKSEKKIADLLSSFEKDEYTTFDNQINNFQIEKYSRLLNFLNSQRKGTIITLDNYQILAEYGQKTFLETIISPILSSNNISLILSGTKNIYTSELFEEIILEPIEKNIYENFIISLFNKCGKIISNKALSRIFEWSLCNTNAVQLICSRVWHLQKKKIKVKDVNNVIEQILDENYKNILSIKNLLSPYQWNLLVIIAYQNKPFQITSASFIKEHGLNAPSSVNTAIKALIDKDIIFRQGRNYQLKDVILKRWLENFKM